MQYFYVAIWKQFFYFGKSYLKTRQSQNYGYRKKKLCKWVVKCNCEGTSPISILTSSTCKDAHGRNITQ